MVFSREGGSEATLGKGEEAVCMKVLMDTTGKNGFEDLTEDGGEADGTIGRGDGRRFVGFEE